MWLAFVRLERSVLLNRPRNLASPLAFIRKYIQYNNTLNKRNMKFDLVTIVNSVAPSHDTVKSEIMELKISNPKLSEKQLADKFVSKITKKYTSVGVASALPSVIPGLGTAAQIAVEAGTISGDLALMLRWMATMCVGVGMIHNKDMTQNHNQEFIKILGIWSGVIMGVKEATKRIGTKVAVVQFNRNVSGKVLQKINQRVGTTIVTKYGTKRGGIALGKLIPFGVGAAVAGTFNYSTMNGFGKAALKYYENDFNEDFVIL
jgi:hypothetical protein